MTENQTEVKTVDIATLRRQLTKKNEQYVLQLERSLKEAQVSKAKITSTLEEMLPVLVEKQKKRFNSSPIIWYCDTTNTICIGRT